MTLTLERAREILIHFQDIASSKLRAGGIWNIALYGYWFMERWPTEIDHINLDKTDNRIDNLREVVRWQNNANHPVRKDSASGLKGVYLHQKSKKLEKMGVRGISAVLIRKKKRTMHISKKRSAYSANLQEQHKGTLSMKREPDPSHEGRRMPFPICQSCCSFKS